MAILDRSASVLRQTILRRALSLVAERSFTRNTLIAALSGLPTSADGSAPVPREKYESVIDTLFGEGSAAEKALVGEWEAEGLRAIKGAFQESLSGRPERDLPISPAAYTRSAASLTASIARLRQFLSARLEYSSSTASENLVQAHAILASPSYASATPSLRIPTAVHSITRGLAERLRLPPAYILPDEVGSGKSPKSAGAESSRPSEPTFGRDYVTVPLVNPLPILQYGFRIADEVLSASKGEQEGGGTDWYARRLALSLIYLHAESHLLHPRPQQASPSFSDLPKESHARTADPLLPAALAQLDASLGRYAYLAERNAEMKSAERQFGEFGQFVWKSWGGLFRSRGWIN